MKTVGDFIKELSKFNLDLPLVLVKGYSDGYVQEFYPGTLWSPSFKDIIPNHKPSEVRVMLENLEDYCEARSLKNEKTV